MAALTRHDPRCVGTLPHRPCFGTQAMNRRGLWVAYPPGACNLSDDDGFCYVHHSMACDAKMLAYDEAHHIR